MKQKKKRHLTLIEIMIVIALIGLIGSVVAYNLKGSLEQGKAFKTEQAQSQINDVLWLEVAKGKSVEDVAANWLTVVKNSPIVKDAEKLTRDGWDQRFECDVVDNDFVLRSERYDLYKGKQDGL